MAACSTYIKMLRVNRRTLSMYTTPGAKTLTTRLADVPRDDMLEAYVGELVQLQSGEPSFEGRSVNCTLNGRCLDILLKGVVLPDRAQPWSRVMMAVDDITGFEDARRRTAASQLYARGVFKHAPVSLWVENFSTIKMLLGEVRMQDVADFRTFTDVYPEFVKHCMQEIQVLDVNGFTLGMFKARNRNDLLDRLPEIFCDNMRPHFCEQLIDLWEGKPFQQREAVNYGLDGNPLNIHLQFSMFPGCEKDWDMVLLALADITAHKKTESYLEHFGKHDVLTKLKNRSFYMDKINRLERKDPFPATIIMIDLNDLKRVNDQLGRAAGDALLRRAGEVLGKAIDKPAYAACIGGDEFAVLLPGANAQADTMLAEGSRKLIELDSQFYPGTELGFSIGCTTYHEGGHLEGTLREAGVAIYEDKRVQHEGERTA